MKNLKKETKKRGFKTNQTNKNFKMEKKERKKKERKKEDQTNKQRNQKLELNLYPVQMLNVAMIFINFIL